MKIAKLIELLGQYPDDVDVLVEGYENGYDPVHSLSMKTVAGVQDAADYDGILDTPNNLVLEKPGEKLTGITGVMARKENGEWLDCIVISGLRCHVADRLKSLLL